MPIKLLFLMNRIYPYKGLIKIFEWFRDELDKLAIKLK
jgi:hypothetical protein